MASDLTSVRIRPVKTERGMAQALIRLLLASQACDSPLGTVDEGARIAVEICMSVKPGEHVLIVTDSFTGRIGEALKLAAEKASPGKVKIAFLEDFGKRPLVSLPKPLEEAIPWANVTFYAARSMDGELDLRMPFIKLAKRYARHGHMPSVNEQLMEEGMCADYEKISELTKQIHQHVANAKRARVITAAGSDLAVEFCPQWRWKLSDGIFRKKGDWGNLPDGELFTAAWKAEGTIVADELGDWFSDKYGVLDKSPVTISVRNSRADLSSIRCSNKELRMELAEYLQTDKNSTRLGEFAIGTNTSLTKLIGNLLQDEKFPTVHVAFGDPYPDETGADWESRTHIDAIMMDATLWVDNSKLMEKGRFLL
jgi:aminopeptidase